VALLVKQEKLGQLGRLVYLDIAGQVEIRGQLDLWEILGEMDRLVQLD
jgi:hypothetical protein